ncbi:MAG: PLP-dependent aminotransferase family protein [Acidimicrobiia bacterium]|nr:PLP-dependent aminotransferase family protein [Acidimicrobiia bacterium]
MNLQANRRPGGDLSADDVAGALADWSDSAHGSLARRLASAFRRAVDAGLLPDGSRLPPERSLASALAVSRSTVTAALDDLRGDGVLVSRQGSGTVVRAAPAPALGTTRVGEHLRDWPGIDLAAGNPPDPSHWPPISLDVADLIAEGGGPGVQPLGLPALRAALAERHTADGRVTDVDQVHVTAGAHQALSLLASACVRRGDAVALEETTYPGMFDIVEHLRARAVPVPTDRAGMRPDALEQVLTSERPRLLYVQAGPHNPTGRDPSRGRLRGLAPILDRHGTTVIEDAALADLSFAGRVRPELADLCRRTTVVSVGSFSKVAWGGLRVGWMRAPAPLVERTMQLRLVGDLGPSVPSQLLALRLLPHMDDLAARRRANLSAAVERAIGQLAVYLPEWRVSEPAGGSVLWAQLPVPDSGPFCQLARRHGVHVAPGSVARAERGADPHIRICVDRPWNVVEEGLRRLAVAWHDLQQGSTVVLG